MWARSQTLVVDPQRYAGELARFWAKVVTGPLESDCAIWCGAIGDDGYGRFWIKRGGLTRVVGAHRYALAAAVGSVDAGINALHACNNPACVRVHLLHVHAGTQLENMNDMGRAGRGGGSYPPGLRPGLDRAGRARRSHALRDAVAGGWDAAAVEAAFLGSSEPTLF
ncbi:hypothetical protein [Mycobacteroides chelonae]|uniref:hypothetical protein n=1 Tax=Mycobacteroides chelonae TaxID=1774 RepID=UPI00099324D7|nr:hypothetical protein [Mycobacteroides chelonae]